MNNYVYIITGKRGEGKTTTLVKLSDLLQNKGVNIGGFIAERDQVKSKRSGYVLVQLAGNVRINLCRTEYTEGYFRLGSFWFNPEAVRTGERILLECIKNKTQLVFIDEIGIFELEGKLWHDAFVSLLQTKDMIIIASVRTKITEDVIKLFKIKEYTIYTAGNEALRLTDDLLQRLGNERE